MTIMGIATTTTTTTCCLKLPSPSSTSTSKSKLNQVSSWNGGGSWRKNCVVGMTCVIIGSEMMMMPVVLGQSEICASAAVVEKNNNMQIQVEGGGGGGGGVVRWSDKRTCPPWQTNSLEIVVPENLPRPSSHRRSESIALSKNPPTSSSTVIRLAIRGQGSCFSM